MGVTNTQQAVRRVSCPRCGHRFTLDGYLAETKDTVRVSCRCGGTAIHRPDGRSCHVESRAPRVDLADPPAFVCTDRDGAAEFMAQLG